MRRMEPQRITATLPSIPSAQAIIAAKLLSPRSTGFNSVIALVQEVDDLVLGGTVVSIRLSRSSGVYTSHKLFSMTASLMPRFRVSAKYRSKAACQMGLEFVCGPPTAVVAGSAVLTMAMKKLGLWIVVDRYGC